VRLADLSLVAAILAYCERPRKASPTSRSRGAIGLGALPPHSNTPSLRVAGFEDEDDDEDSLPDEACGSIITPAEKSASQARRAPRIGERNRENEAARLVG
jgi:hypothetical protein